LKQALETGLISGAACDVFLQEPAYTTNDSVLLSKDIPNLLLTPHIGASTAEAQESCAIDVASKMIAHLTKG
jgi:D-3-phosphoglycerate dehydrogenase